MIDAGCVIAAGEQVFETYGDNTNLIYFMYHGFIPHENKYECVDVTMPELSEPKLQERIKVVRQGTLVALLSRLFLRIRFISIVCVNADRSEPKLQERIKVVASW